MLLATLRDILARPGSWVNVFELLPSGFHPCAGKEA